MCNNSEKHDYPQASCLMHKLRLLLDPQVATRLGAWSELFFTLLTKKAVKRQVKGNNTKEKMHNQRIACTHAPTNTHNPGLGLACTHTHMHVSGYQLQNRTHFRHTCPQHIELKTKQCSDRDHISWQSKWAGRNDKENSYTCPMASRGPPKLWLGRVGCRTSECHVAVTCWHTALNIFPLNSVAKPQKHRQ